jgi:hypothetical protein
MGVLLGCFSTVLLPLGWAHIVDFLVLSAKLHVHVDENAFIIYLGLENYTVPVLVVDFYIFDYHCAGQSLMIQSTSSLLT